MSDLLPGIAAYYEELQEKEKAELIEVIENHLVDDLTIKSIIQALIKQKIGTDGALEPLFVSAINFIADNSEDFENWKNGVEKKQPVVFDKAS